MLTPESLVLAALAVCAILSLLRPFVAGPVRVRLRSRQASDTPFCQDTRL